MGPLFSNGANMARNVKFGGARGGWPVDAVCGALPEVVQDFVRQQ